MKRYHVSCLSFAWDNIDRTTFYIVRHEAV
jgi:hypothetical protein